MLLWSKKGFNPLKIGASIQTKSAQRKRVGQKKIFPPGNCIVTQKITTDVGVENLKSVPSKFPCSVYKLSRDVLKRGRFPQIDPCVDAYNLMSLKHLVPMAGYDMDKIEGGVVLRFSSEGEVFLPIGAREVERLTSGEPVYADAKKTLCSKWNYRDSELTKLTAETSNVLFVVDGASPVTAEDVQVVLDELSELVAHWNPKEKAHAIISPAGVREIEL